MNTGTLRVACATVIAALLVAACSEKPPEMRSLKVSGTVQVPADAATPGQLHVMAYHAWTGVGELRHPLLFMGEFTAPVGDFSGTIEYPAGAGEGLVIYAWADADGDGVLCTPQNDTELAGLTEVADFPADEVSVESVTECQLQVSELVLSAGTLNRRRTQCIAISPLVSPRRCGRSMKCP